MICKIAYLIIKIFITVKHLNLAAANFGGLYYWTFWRIYILADFRFPKKNKKKSVITDRDLLCMRVLHGDLQVKHIDFHLFSTSHCSWCANEYKSVLLLFNYYPFYS